MTEAGALGAFKPIRNSRYAPCTVQRDIAAHNSVYDTLKTKKEVVYKAPCDTDPKPEKPATPAVAATEPQGNPG